MASPGNSSVSSQSQSTTGEDSESTGTLDLAADGVDCHRAVLQRSEAVSVASVISRTLDSATTTSNLVPTTIFASGHPATIVTTNSKRTDYPVNIDGSILTIVASIKSCI